MITHTLEYDVTFHFLFLFFFYEPEKLNIFTPLSLPSEDLKQTLLCLAYLVFDIKLLET